MELTGKVIAILEPQSFTSKKDGNVYITTVFVIETQGQYPKKVAFKVMGEDRFKGMQIVVGHNYNVSFDVESREWQGKWFTECSAWKAICIDGQNANTQQAQTASPAPAAPAAPAPSGGDGEGEQKDDLPF
jgi:hypothetical protein